MWLSWPVRHPWWTVVLVAVACGGAVAAVLRLRPDASLEGLFPRDSASGAAVVRVLNDFAVAEELLVLVTVPESSPAATRGDPADPLLLFADRLERAIRSDPQLNSMASGVVSCALQTTSLMARLASSDRPPAIALPQQLVCLRRPL